MERDPGLGSCLYRKSIVYTQDSARAVLREGPGLEKAPDPSLKVKRLRSASAGRQGNGRQGQMARLPI